MADQKKILDIKEKIIKVFKRDASARGNISELRVISWVVDGKVRAPKFERREKYTTEDGEHERPGKAGGLTLEDLAFVADHYEEIVAAMTGKTEPKKETAEVF